jgi:5,10-methylenetetrahydromethanopterin reductase
MRQAEVWLHAFPTPGRTVGLAKQVEGWGFDGLLLADSETLVADPYVELALAANATERLRLGPAVTNPITRLPSVTASAVATLQAESGGRAVLAMGRGDSALAQLGRRSATSSELERALVRVQGFLRGEPVQLGTGATVRITWIESTAMPKVPLDVAASGPRTMAIGARHAERVTFTVGADPSRIKWALSTARVATKRRQLDRPPSFGAYVNFAVDDDRSVACDLVRGSAAIFARFVSEGPMRDMPDGDRAVIERLAAAYDERGHGLSSADHAALLPDDFLDRFAIVGPPEHCVARLRELLASGLERVVAVPASRDADPGAVAASNARFAREVLPEIR